jgi:hypothetical protein
VVGGGGTFCGLGPFVAVTFWTSGISSGWVGRPSLAECSARRCFSPKHLMTARFVGAPFCLSLKSGNLFAVLEESGPLPTTKDEL